MTPTERLILKSLGFIITEINNNCRETDLEERISLMYKIDKALAPKSDEMGYEGDIAESSHLSETKSGLKTKGNPREINVKMYGASKAEETKQ